jgi:hypothetical protein
MIASNAPSVVNGLVRVPRGWELGARSLELRPCRACLQRPHSSLGYKTPKEFAAAQAAGFYTAEREARDSNAVPCPSRSPIVRVDGAVVPETFELGPGLTTDVPPGETWRGILALRQSHSSFGPAVKFGALVRRGRREVAIRGGKHTITVQCGGVWSDDFTFYWEGD